MAGVRAEADPVGRSLVVSGQWRYRGQYTVRAAEGGSLLQYRMDNVAPRATRWLVPLVAGARSAAPRRCSSGNSPPSAPA
jgi:hypothetical protein